MSKLLLSGFSRLFKNKLFYAFAAFSAVLGAVVVFITDSEFTIDKILYVYSVLIGFVSAVITSMFLGTEYSDNTIRNKLIAGHKRSSVYLAGLIVSSVAAIIIAAVYCVTAFALGSVRLNPIETPFSGVLLQFGLSVLMTTAYTAVFTLISMLVGKKSASAVACLLLSMVLLFTASYIKSALEEPEYYEAYSYEDLDGNIISEGETKNDNYLNSAKRNVYEFIYDTMPSGQALQISYSEVKNPERVSGMAAAFIVITTGAGLIAFRKKDIA